MTICTLFPSSAKRWSAVQDNNASRGNSDRSKGESGFVRRFFVLRRSFQLCIVGLETCMGSIFITTDTTTGFYSSEAGVFLVRGALGFL